MPADHYGFFMQIIQVPQTEEITPCPYLEGREKQLEFFGATEVSSAELSRLLATGWRKFGPCYFKPACPDCRLCIPLRVPVADFAPSRSQRRVLRKGAGLQARFGPLRFSERIYQIYQQHSRHRFAQECDLEGFLQSFYLPSCPCLQEEIYLGDELIGVGFLDRGEDCLSSIYFCFDPAYNDLNPGTFSALQEIAYARRIGVPYYYLGYYVPGSARMAYKDRFRPREHYDWSRRGWQRVSDTLA